MNVERKATQIVTQAAMSDAGILIHAGLFALCDDGTIWFRRSGEDCWKRLSAIPQDISADAR